MQKSQLAIIGSGPAGYSAGIYASRALLKPILFAGFEQGGQLMLTTEVENYPGFAQGVDGPMLMSEMRGQAERFGTKIISEYVTAVDFSERPFKIWTNFPEKVLPEMYKSADNETFAKYQEQIKQKEPAAIVDSVIIATGATAILLGVPGESEFMGRGVSTCAVCDAAFYREKDTFVVGGGDSAMEDTLALTKFAKSVTIVHRRSQFRASKIMQERVLANPKVKVLWNSQLEEVLGDQLVSGVRINVNGESKEFSAHGVFIAIGHQPVTRMFEGQIQLDDHGYAVTRQSYSQFGIKAAEAAINKDGLVEFPTMTSVEGVFAAGDGVDVRYKQAVTAAGQGASSAIDAERWLESRG